MFLNETGSWVSTVITIVSHVGYEPKSTSIEPQERLTLSCEGGGAVKWVAGSGMCLSNECSGDGGMGGCGVSWWLANWW